MTNVGPLELSEGFFVATFGGMCEARTHDTQIKSSVPAVLHRHVVSVGVTSDMSTDALYVSAVLSCPLPYSNGCRQKA